MDVLLLPLATTSTTWSSTDQVKIKVKIVVLLSGEQVDPISKTFEGLQNVSLIPCL